MSTKYPGGIITKNYVAPTPSSASGVWTLEQQEQAQKAGIWPFGGPFNYIEDVFSTYLWDGNATARNIVNGIDLATKGGMVWAKYRNATASNRLYDTARGATKQIFSDLTNAEQTAAQSLTSFNTDGFSLGTGQPNENTATVVGWTFRKQPKFFDVVTWTGNASSRTISHSLGSVPACIIVKNTSAVGDWVVYHRSLSTPQSSYMKLNTTDAVATGNTYIWDNTAPTSTVFSVGASGFTNNTGENYVAYIFAHDAGGFGLTGTDNVISCGSYTGTGANGNNVTLGYEPQWVMTKRTNGQGNWNMEDVMRGLPASGNAQELLANSSFQEQAVSSINVTSTGFQLQGAGGDYNGSGNTYIYIAIRRGPMKVPTDATKVFKPTTGTVSVNSVVTTGFATDMVITAGTGAVERGINDRLRGFPITNTGTSPWLVTQSTAAEANYSGTNTLFNATNTTFQQGYYFSGAGAAQYSFLRAPSFFDVVCTNGDASGNLSFTHSLGVLPELVIMKTRTSAAYQWYLYSAHVPSPLTTYSTLNGNSAFANTGLTYYAPTATTFQTFTGGWTANNGATVVYLFATCPGVSKLGSYTGTGATQTIACGFTGGARFVLIRRTDSTGDWYVWDTARGMVSGTDPSLLLNSTAAEVNANSIYTTTGGFQIVSTAAGINASGGSYIFLAIA